MIIFTFSEEPPAREGYAKIRKIFSIELQSIGISSQYFNEEESKWIDFHGDHYSICLNFKYWSFGFDHYYYDGPNCSFSLGPIHFNWRNLDKNCKKCLNN